MLSMAGNRGVVSESKLMDIHVVNMADKGRNIFAGFRLRDNYGRQIDRRHRILSAKTRPRHRDGKVLSYSGTFRSSLIGTKVTPNVKTSQKDEA
jgi:hypothetical protein